MSEESSIPSTLQCMYPESQVQERIWSEGGSNFFFSCMEDGEAGQLNPP